MTVKFGGSKIRMNRHLHRWIRRRMKTRRLHNMIKTLSHLTLTIALLVPISVLRSDASDTNNDQAAMESTKQALMNDFANIATDKQVAQTACVHPGAACQAARSTVQADMNTPRTH